MDDPTALASACTPSLGPFFGPRKIPARAGLHSSSCEIADSDDLARVYRFDLAQDSEMISPTIPI
ncbi:hypothetical protein BSN85_18230 [Bradyrhizobium brasilense]|nr:hypothetical protein BSN85_18230 [Bradyrhizobium brasilense]